MKEEFLNIFKQYVNKFQSNHGSEGIIYSQPTKLFDETNKFVAEESWFKDLWSRINNAISSTVFCEYSLPVIEKSSDGLVKTTGRSTFSIFEKLFTPDKVPSTGTSVRCFGSGTSPGDKATIDNMVVLPTGSKETDLSGRNLGDMADDVKQAENFKYSYNGKYQIPDSLPEPSKKVSDILLKASNEVGVDYSLLKAICYNESGFDINVKNGTSGEIGLMQLMPLTAKGIGVDPTIPERNVFGGALYIKQWLDANQGNIELALANYNGGPGGVSNGKTTSQDVRNYINRVMPYYLYYEQKEQELKKQEKLNSNIVTKEGIDKETGKLKTKVEKVPEGQKNTTTINKSGGASNIINNGTSSIEQDIRLLQKMGVKVELYANKQVIWNQVLVNYTSYNNNSMIGLS